MPRHPRNIFRREVLEHKNEYRVGETLTVSPISFKLAGLFVTGILVALGCFLYWGTYSDKQTVSGYILPSKGIVTVYSPQRGVTVARYVHLGDHVHEGQKLYQIALQRSTLKTKNVNAALLQQYDAQLQSIQSQIKLDKQLLKAKIDQLKNQQSDFRIKFKHLGKEFKTEQSILALNKDNLSRYQKLAGTGMVSESDLQKVRQKMLTQQAEVEQIEKTQLDLRAQLHQIPTELSQAKADTAGKIAALENQSAQTKQQRLQLQVAQEVVLRAPVNGVVSSIIMRVGQNVTDQTPLLSILPHGSVFEARLLVPTRAIGFVHVGEPVRLRYSAFPYQQFGLYRGKVSKVSRSIISPSELNLPLTLREPYYLVTASLAKPYVRAYGRLMPLTAGMTLSADIVLNRERLYEWVLRPIKSLRGRL